MTVLAGIVLLYWIVLLIQELLNLASLPSLDASPSISDAPFVSVIVPARDEEAAIEQSVRAFLGQDYPGFEVVVVNDRSGDLTGEILERLAADHPALRLIHGQEPPPQWLGKPWALHQGAAAARGDLLLFVDADVIYEPGALRSLVGFFLTSGVGVVSVFPRMKMSGFWENLLMPWLAFMAFVMMPLWLSNRSSHWRIALGGGPGNLLRRDTYAAIGGHEALRDAVIDDVGLVRRVRRAGGRTLAVRADRLISLRMYRGFHEIVEGFTKNTAVAMGHNLGSSVVMLILAVLVHLLPYALAVQAMMQWFAGESISSAALLGVASVVVIASIRLILHGALGYSLPGAAVGHVLASPIFLWIFSRSVWRTNVRRQLVWRGRTYSSDWVRFGGE